MEISTYVHENDIIVLEVISEVDAYTAPLLDETLMDLLSQGQRRIVIDVSGMTFISSAGIRAIYYAYREAVRLGGEIRLVGPTDKIRRLFEIAGLLRLIKCTDDIQESINNW